MKARLPQGYGKNSNNVANMVKQAQKVQEDMNKLQEELEVTEYQASVGGGAVEISITGKKVVKSLKIKPEVVDPEDVEMLQDLLVSAFNEGVRMAEEDSEKRMAEITQGMNVGGLGSLL